jgi:hypothetical protein
MKCANPKCQHKLLYLRGGTLRLLELDGPPVARLRGEGAGFPVCCQSAQCFWLCGECSKTLVLKRWTREGLILESRDSTDRAEMDRWTVEATPAVSADSVLHFHKSIAKSA